MISKAPEVIHKFTSPSLSSSRIDGLASPSGRIGVLTVYEGSKFFEQRGAIVSNGGPDSIGAIMNSAWLSLLWHSATDKIFIFQPSGVFTGEPVLFRKWAYFPLHDDHGKVWQI